MERIPRQRRWLLVLFLSGAAALVLPASGRAQRGMDGDAYDRGQKAFANEPYGVSEPEKKQAAPPAPCNGQLFCPVTGVKLGLHQPAVPVQTSLGEKKPSFMGKLRGEKGSPGAVIYVCCPECAEKVRRDPVTYLGVVIADKGSYSGIYTLATAPAQRPAREPIVPDPHALGAPPAPEIRPVAVTQPQ